MCLSFVLRAVESCTLQNYVYADFAPWKISSLWLLVDGDFLAVYSDGILSSLNSVQTLAINAGISALCCIIL